MQFCLKPEPCAHVYLDVRLQEMGMQEFRRSSVTLRAPRPCSHYPLSGCCGGVEMRGREGGDGGDWLAKPTSPVDSEQMGPDSPLTHQCQGYFGLLL